MEKLCSPFKFEEYIEISAKNSNKKLKLKNNNNFKQIKTIFKF